MILVDSEWPPSLQAVSMALLFCQHAKLRPVVQNVQWLLLLGAVGGFAEVGRSAKSALTPKELLNEVP